MTLPVNTKPPDASVLPFLSLNKPEVIYDVEHKVSQRTVLEYFFSSAEHTHRHGPHNSTTKEETRRRDILPYSRKCIARKGENCVTHSQVEED